LNVFELSSDFIIINNNKKSNQLTKDFYFLIIGNAQQPHQSHLM